MELKEYLKSNFLVLDGAMGTMLQNAGMEAGALPELYNLTNPELITSIHRQYVEAGSDMVLTCTFGANEKKAAGCGHEIEELITAAVANARASGAKFVGLDVGPIGELLAPTGTLDFDDAYRMFARQIVCGAQAGVDAIYIETMTDLLETKAAVLAAKENCDLPVFATMSFEATGRTFLGVPPEAAAITLQGLGADAIGINCSLGPVEILPIAARMAEYASIPLILKPNAGLPVVSDGSFHYNITPEQFIEALRDYLPLRFTIFGGCCGTSPEYIKNIRTMLSGAEFALPERKRTAALCSGTKFVPADGVCVIGERINPTGKKKFKAALQEHDIDYIIDQGIEQADAGAHILDVNVGLPGIDEREMMLEVTQELQSVLDLPLQLDSNDPNVLEASLRRYNGVPMINSVNGEEASLNGILPLAAKYGTMVVGLTLDENGIPDSVEKRIAIAEKIVTRAAQYGIPPERIAIDCLTLTVSAEPSGAMQTLSALTEVKRRFGVKTCLGVSNISFGLPQRERINAHFLAIALAAGLDFPIINPNIASMMSAVDVHNLLHMRDEGSVHYIEKYAVTEGTAAPAPSSAKEMDIATAVKKGLGDECAAATEHLLDSNDPLVVVSDHLIPALDIVGDLFEQNKLFLPQLIRAAEAAKCGFDAVRARLAKTGSAEPSANKVILATVKGDIHDIGKNIVKVVMENYGFSIIDLGRDVPPERVVQTAREQNVRLVGLSALMTTTLGAMEETIRQLRADGFDGKVFVGGAVLTPDYAETIGADYYCKDAKASVDVAKEFFGA